MSPWLRDRIDYGRRIRAEAGRVVETYGVRAEAAAWREAAEEELSAEDRAFRRFVAQRITRWMDKLAPPGLG
jgi:hypothetical protein